MGQTCGETLDDRPVEISLTKQNNLELSPNPAPMESFAAAYQLRQTQYAGTGEAQAR